MAYFGNEPSKQAIKIGDNTILSSNIADGVIINADIKSDAAIAMSKTALVAGTGITLATNTLNVDAAQTQITSVGTLTSLTTGAITQNAGTLTIKNASGDSNGLKIYQDTSDASKIYNHYNGTLQLGVGSTTAITIDSSENTTFAGTVILGDLDIIPTSSNVSVIKHDSGSGSLTLQGDQVNIKNRAADETGLSYNDGGGVTFPNNVIIGGENATPEVELFYNHSNGNDYKAYLQLVGNDLEIRSSSGTMEFYTGAVDGTSSTERMRILSTGQVGIGTTSAATATNVLLTVGDTSLGYAGMEIRAGTNGESWRLYSSYDGSNNAIFGLYRVADASYKFQVGENGNATFAGGTTTFPVGGIIRFGERGNITHDSTSYNMSFNTNSVSNAVVVTGTGMLQAKRGFTAGQALDIEGDTFGRTNSSNIALGIRQDGAGDLLVLQQSSNNVFTLDGEGRTYLYAHSNARTSLNVVASGSGQAPNDAKVYVEKNSSADWSFLALAGADDYGYKAKGVGSYAILVENQSSNANVFRVEYDGDILAANTSIASISDRRLKKEITNASSQWDDIKALNFVNYKWKKSTGMDDSIKYLGLIADEVESVSPNLIKIDAQSKEDIEAGVEDPEYKTVKYSIVWMKAVKALQEAMERIEKLENA